MRRSIKRLLSCLGLSVCALTIAGAAQLEEANLELPFRETSAQVKVELSQVQSTHLLVGTAHVPEQLSVTNKGIACWIRAKRTYERAGARFSEAIQVEGCSVATLVAPDGYVYFLEPLEENACFEWSELVGTPRELQDGSNQDLHTNVEVEALQAASFAPAWQSEDPWAGQVVEAFVVSEEERV